MEPRTTFRVALIEKTKNMLMRKRDKIKSEQNVECKITDVNIKV